MGDVLLDAFLDTLKVLPFLLVMNFLIELVEYGTKGLKANKILKGGFAPLLGATVGIVPQCGFSVVATELYSKRKIALGTLLAVYLATSDEALPIMLSSPAGLAKILPVLIIKVCFSIAVGYAVFGAEKIAAAYKRKRGGEMQEPDGNAAPLHMCNSAHDEIIDNNAANADACAHVHTSDNDDGDLHDAVGHEHEHAHEHEHEHDDDGVSVHIHGCHHHSLEEHEKLPENATKKQKAAHVWRAYLKHPILHTATVMLFILIVNVVFGITVYYIGTDRLAAFVSSTGYLQPVLSALVGLIPNCAASVVITEMYVVGGLNLGGAVAGLCVSAGIGYAVLVKQNRPVKNTVLIIAAAYVLSVALGLCVTALGY